MAQKERIVVREVGPRDGLQAAAEIMPTSLKLRWLDALVAAGLQEIEVASFVPAHLLPQMADADIVVRHVRAAHPQVRAAALAPNLFGAQAAAAAGANTIIVPISASDAHNERNVRRSTDEQIAAVAKIAAWAKGLSDPVVVEAGISASFGCSIEGAIPTSRVANIAAQLVEAGLERVLIADTLGYATPTHVRKCVTAVREVIGDRLAGLHLHDTLGTGLANVMAGVETGIRRFDGALAGLGGCPFAPGSVGNVATEDVVYLLESEGFDTGVDLHRLIEARKSLREGLPNEPLHSRVAAAGIPITYRPSFAAAAE